MSAPCATPTNAGIMPSIRRLRLTSALLAAVLMVSVVAPAADARAPGTTRDRAGGPITLDTNLRSRSGLSVWAIDEYLAATTPLPALGEAFMAAERKYGVNARFLLAAALHESGRGTSYISRVKHNLFGFNAYDRDPVRYASAYRTYAANIDAVAKFIKTQYLTPGGRWWGGRPTLRSMQRYWSSSGRWGESVSRVARAIRLPSLSRRSIRVATPVVNGLLHGGSRTTVKLAWSGGSIPAAITFAATWAPVELDAEGADTPLRVVARRVRTGSRSLTLSLAAPRAPGRYRLTIQLLDRGRVALPRADRLRIPAAEVRIWGDRAVRYELGPSADGTGAVLRITNTGRETIPAAATWTATMPDDPEVMAARSVVTVTAVGDDPEHAAPVRLIAAPLAGDLAPGASVSFNVPDILGSTGRRGNWLAASLSVLGDPGWLPASPPAGRWFSDEDRTGAEPVATPIPTVAPTPTPAPSASPSPAPTATARPAPTAMATPTPMPRPAATPSPTPRPTPKTTATPKPKPAATSTPAPSRRAVTKAYTERSGAIRYRGGWGSAPHDRYRGGSVAWSERAGATAAFTFTGKSVRWIGPMGPTRGRALVLIDGRAVARVSLWRSSFLPQAVLFRRTFGSVGRHTITIRVLSAPGRQTVAIDGFDVRR